MLQRYLLWDKRRRDLYVTRSPYHATDATVVRGKIVAAWEGTTDYGRGWIDNPNLQVRETYGTQL